MTPYELGLSIGVFNETRKQEDEDRLILTYLGAAWQRAKKMPDLKSLLSKQDDSKQMSDEQMYKKVKQLNAAFGGTKNKE